MGPIPSSSGEPSSSCQGMRGLPASELGAPFEAMGRRVNELVPEGCVDREGCPEVVSLPPCDSELLRCQELATPQTFHPRARKLEGKKVAVRGQLVRLRKMTTVLQCTEGTCCNRSRAMLSVGDGADAVMLLDGDWSGVFTCFGDESANCCVLEPGGEIAAIGVVSAHKLGHGLRQVELCSVPSGHKNEEASR